MDKPLPEKKFCNLCNAELKQYVDSEKRARYLECSACLENKDYERQDILKVVKVLYDKELIHVISKTKKQNSKSILFMIKQPKITKHIPVFLSLVGYFFFIWLIYYFYL